MSREVRVGVIGCGGIARRHMRALQGLEGARLVACCDVDAERARSAAQQVGAEMWCTDYRELLTGDRIDAAVICTPNATHGEIGLVCVRAGKHALVEKPLATTTEEAYAMVNAAAAGGVKLMGAHTHRFYRYSLTVKELIRSGEIGKPVYISLSMLNPFYASDWNNWVFDFRVAGGQLMQNGVHLMDLVNFWMDDEPEHLYCLGERVTSRNLEFEDYLAVVIAYRGGGIASWELSRANRPRWIDQRVSLICGTKGQIVLDSDLEKWPVMTATGREDLYPDYQHGFDLQLRLWIESILNDTEPPMPARAAALAVEMTAAAQLSLDTGKVVHLGGTGR